MEARGMESQEEGPFPPRPLSSQPGQDGAVCCTFPRGWALPLWLRDGAFCLALGPLSLPGPLPAWPPSLPGHLCCSVDTNRLNNSGSCQWDRQAPGPAPAAVEGQPWRSAGHLEPPPHGNSSAPSQGTRREARRAAGPPAQSSCPGPRCAQLPLLSDQEGKDLTFVRI